MSDKEKAIARLAYCEATDPAGYAAAWDWNHCICGHEHGEHENDAGRCLACPCDEYLEPGGVSDPR